MWIYWINNLAIFLKQKKYSIFSIDNLFRKGSNLNEKRLKLNGIKNFKIDISNFNKIKKLPKFDIIIDCCAEPSVNVSIKELDRLIYTNFIGTLNVLKKCIKDNSKIIFLSSSRVYSIDFLNNLIKAKEIKNRIKIKKLIKFDSPITNIKSLYGFTKLASEDLIKEISYKTKLKYIINRCGVVAGPWQFGKVDQGFFSLWIWRHLNKKLSYNGFGGYGNQVRDVLHIEDLNNLIYLQIKKINKIYNETFLVGGGYKNALSLKDLTSISQKLTNIKIKINKKKKTFVYDIPYFVSSNLKISKKI